MDFSGHVLISASGAGALWLGSGDPAASAAFFAAGAFLDLDHFLDYWRETGFNFRADEFLDYFQTEKPRRLFLLLHGWEWLLLMAVLAWLQAWPVWTAWALAGCWLHLLLDHRFNRLHPLSYFFLFRLRHAFSTLHIYQRGRS